MLKEKNKQKFICHPEVLTEGSIDSSHSFRMTQCETGRSTSSSSFPCLTRESTWCGLNAPRCAQYAQSGRSMVEMLGVLAVIGVLSIAGIAGYSNAMNKHRANELLNEASKRAAIVAVQAMQGRENLSISEFGTENTRLNFSETVDHDTTNNQFTLTITGVAEAVCQQMNNAKGPVIRKFEPATCSGDNNTVKLTFNDDMSATEKASDFTTSDTCKSPYKWCSESETCVSGDCTCSGTAPECQICDPATGGYTADHNQDEQSCTPTGGGTGTCNDGTCVATPTCTLTSTDCPQGIDTTNCVCVSTVGQTCTSHTTNQCGLGYYCQFSPSSCSASGNGVCTAISGGTEVDGHWVGPNLDWWSANSWCIGKGSSGSITYATLQSAYDCDKDTYSCDWTTLNDKGLAEHYWWSAEDYGNSCDAWLVAVSDGYFPPTGRDGSYYYALCE